MTKPIQKTDQSKRNNPSLEPFFNQSMDCLCIADEKGFFVKVNPAFTRLLGYSQKELKSKLISSFIHPDDRKLTERHRKKLLKNVPLVNFENRYIRKSGAVVWLYWTATPILDNGLIYAIAKDITHIKTLEKERTSRLSQLSQTNKKLKRHSYTTSHDLRAPLNNIISLLQLMDTQQIQNEQTLEILDLITQSVHGLKNTMDSHLDSYKQLEILSSPKEEVNFHEVFEKVSTTIDAWIERTGATFETDFSDLQQIPFKVNFMESIFLNFMTNSLKYSRPGVPPKITIRSSQENGIKKLIFADNGLGMDLDKVGHHIFKISEGFHDHEDSKGIGLYLVHNQVTSLGGNIKVESKVNKGTVFTIEFMSDCP